MTRQLRSRIRFLPAVLLAVLMLSAALPASSAPVDLFERYGDAGLPFEMLEIGGMHVYFHQRMIGDAVVEKDRIVYQLDAETGEFLARKSHWRDDLPDALPESLISQGAAEALAPGEALFTRLYIISPESDVFPLDPTPANPCWVIRSVDPRGAHTVTIVDAVEGVVLGNGVPPPYGGFSLTGPWYFQPCEGAWDAWSGNAEDWFELMGYSTEHVVWPTQAQVQGAVQSTQIAVFYELAHGWSYGFSSGCAGGQNPIDTTPSQIEYWIADYGKMPFTFIGSCGGICDTGDGTLSHEFRKGSFEETATAGYCNMAEAFCGDCWVVSIDWQDAFFSYASQGYPVKVALEYANADFPECGGPACMRFAGDPEFAIVPIVARAGATWKLVLNEYLQDAGRGGGAAWGDYDGDGDLDLYLANWNGPNKLFRNDAGEFVDATAAPLDDAGAGTGVAWGDYDNDGDLDLYVANSDGANRLFRNDGAGFTDVTTGPLGDTRASHGVAWADYDLDSDLDLYVANTGYNRLLENLGWPTWEFVVADSSTASAQSEGVAWGDYDNDGDPDLFVANRGMPNRLYRNDGGVLTDVTAPPIGGFATSIGVAWGDYDNDGDLDAFVANMFGANQLLRNQGDGSFVNATAAPLDDPSRDATGVAWLDYDNDGDLDLYVVNYLGSNRLFRNEGPPFWTFTDASIAPLDNDGSGWGVACADFDEDGEIDIYLTNGGANRLFLNDATEGTHWLGIKLVGTISNRSAIGARVRVVSGAGSQIREVSGGSGYLSQDSLPLEFGLGSATVVDTVVVHWPSGLSEAFVGVPADQIIEIVEAPTSGVGEGSAAAGEVTIRGNFPNPFNPVTLIEYELPVESAVTLTVYDLSGRPVRGLLAGDVEPAGRRSARWDGRDDRGLRVASGVYFYRLEAGGEMLERKMVLLK
jgi:hypothetical protein